MAGLSRQGSANRQVTDADKPPPHRTRRVSFDDESTNKNKNRSKNEKANDLEAPDFRDKAGRSCMFMICAWTCIIIFTILIVLLFVGISYLAFLQSGMPSICIRQLNITKLQLDHQDKLSTTVFLLLRITNKNEKLTLLYSPLDVLVNSQGIKLGEDHIDKFSQKPQNDTDYHIKMENKNADVDRHAVEELNSDIQAKEVMYDIFVGGKIGLKLGGLEMANVPFLASCRHIKQFDVNLGRRPECDVRMFGFRPSNN
ncbi:hypothetical protein HN51_000569 [Arachis hypogaea]|uniref:uncharacterized protein n=1 Tax=Arachis hypogaea TaxID=3818 RepID=UPI000DEC1BE6|nr:uncharacterized protein LOC112794331 [Arachis hypogaea]QHO48525.1 uncharacterized protein DS421_1g06170 [Arachis hypogaea]